MNQATLENIRNQITKVKPKMKLIKVIMICLDYIENYPDKINEVGIAWYDDKRIIINIKIFGKFIKRKPNSINKNLRENGFECQKTTFSMRKKIYLSSMTFNDLIDAKKWVLRYTDKIQRKTKQKKISDNLFNFDDKNDDECFDDYSEDFSDGYFKEGFSFA